MTAGFVVAVTAVVVVGLACGAWRAVSTGPGVTAEVAINRAEIPGSTSASVIRRGSNGWRCGGHQARSTGTRDWRQTMLTSSRRALSKPSPSGAGTGPGRDRRGIVG